MRTVSMWTCMQITKKNKTAKERADWKKSFNNQLLSTIRKFAT